MQWIVRLHWITNQEALNGKILQMWCNEECCKHSDFVVAINLRYLGNSYYSWRTEYSDIPLHSNVRWLRRLCPSKRNTLLSSEWVDCQHLWVSKSDASFFVLAFLANITGPLKALNLNLQIQDKNAEYFTANWTFWCFPHKAADIKCLFKKEWSWTLCFL